MKKLLVVTGSVRSGRAADNILALVREELTKYPAFEVSAADFKTMPLPFFDSEFTPSNENFMPTDKNVLRWTEMVDASDAVIVITPEYNASTSAVLKNAIDWISGPWNNKPVALIGYGWSGAASSLNHLADIFNRLKSRVIETQGGLSFNKELELNGAAINDDAGKVVAEVIDAVESAVTAPAATLA